MLPSKKQQPVLSYRIIPTGCDGVHLESLALWKEEAGGSNVQGQLWLHNESVAFQGNRLLCLQTLKPNKQPPPEDNKLIQLEQIIIHRLAAWYTPVIPTAIKAEAGGWRVGSQPS